MNKIFKVGLIGCGHIAETYFRGQQYFNNFKIIACADIDQKAADKCAKLYNIKSKTVSEILKDNEIEVILNLTIPQSHYSVSKKVLTSGKHVYSEKPLATYFAKGNYFETGKDLKIRHLIYPIPNEASLGLHLGLDLGMQVRFGPDVEWVDELDYEVNNERQELFYKDIIKYI